MPALRLLPELEESLRRIPGIRAASVVTGPDSRPTEVHVLAQPGKPAKQVVRDVQSVAMAQFDLDIDHRIVSVVQISELEAPLTAAATPAQQTADAAAPAPEPGADLGAEPARVTAQADPETEDGNALTAGTATVPELHPTDGLAESSLRPALSSIQMRTADGEAEVTVVLTVDGTGFTGTATGPILPVHRPRIVAQAAVAAVSELLGMPAQIESAQLLEVGLREVAVTVLSLSVPRLGEQTLCGAALVRGDMADAVARAVLSALNRRLTG